MRAAACALLGLLAACSPPSRQASLDASARSGPDTDAGAGATGARIERGGSTGESSVAALGAGQAGDARVQAAVTASDAVPPAIGAAALPPASAGVHHQLRVSALSGRARNDAAPLTLDTRLAEGALLQLERGARVTLALDDYVRLVLLGPLLVRVLPDGQPALLLREGALSLDVAPRGVHGTHSAFWLATPLARIDVADSARLVVRASARGAGELAVVSGRALLAQPELALPLNAGSAHCVGPSGLTELSRPFATLEQAVATFASGPSCAGRTGADLGQRERALESALATVERREQSELALLAEHSRLVARADPRAAGLRSVLAGSAGLLMHERGWATAQRSLLEALLLGHNPTVRQTTLLEGAHKLAPYRD